MWHSKFPTEPHIILVLFEAGAHFPICGSQADNVMEFEHKSSNPPTNRQFPHLEALC